MKASDLFLKKTNYEHKYFFNITSIKNVSSIITDGILCYDSVKNKFHCSIAMNEVQIRRDQVIILGGLKLHQYANLYFTFNNPMLYKRKDMANELCILVVSPKVLDIEDCIVSDRNAATNLAKFYPAIEGISLLNYEKIYQKYWKHDDPYAYSNHKAIKCAEILIPKCVPYDYVVGALVASEESKNNLLRQEFKKKILVKPGCFYH